MMDKLLYELACEYQAKTEMFDRGLTTKRAWWDETEALIITPLERKLSTQYAATLRQKLSRSGYYTFEILDATKMFPSYTAQRWIDEWRRIQNERNCRSI